jgi:hypothetical protein
VFRLYPEGDEVEDDAPVTPEDVPVVDEELSLTSTRPVQNQAIARAFARLNAQSDDVFFGEKVYTTEIEGEYNNDGDCIITLPADIKHIVDFRGCYVFTSEYIGTKDIVIPILTHDSTAYYIYVTVDDDGIVHLEPSNGGRYYLQIKYTKRNEGV